MSSGLEFRNFGLGGDPNSPFTENLNSTYDQRNTEKDSANLVENTEVDVAGSRYNFLSFKFYQQFFDVDTEQVQSRILNSAFPRKGCNFIRDHIQPSADLYGPLWISVTLVFAAAICGNFAQYIATLGEKSATNDFRPIVQISTIIALYVLLLPLALYVILYYRQATIQYSFVELVSLYGYSLSIFVPCSVLWVLNYQYFRWMLIIVSVMLSGLVLVSTIWDAVKSDKNKLIAFGVVFGVLFLHASLAVGIKEFYFDTVLPAKLHQEPIATSPLPLTTVIKLVDEGKPKAEALKSPDLPKDVKNDDKGGAKKPVLEAKVPDDKAKDPKLTDPKPDNKNAEQKPAVNSTKTDVKS